MKPHVIIGLRDSININAPYWEDIIKGKSGVPDQFYNVLDSILVEKYKMPFWVTQNYPKEFKEWTTYELEAGLNKIFRIIFKKNIHIPTRLIDDLKNSPLVESVRIGDIGQVGIPVQKISEAASLSQKYRRNGTYLQEAHLYSKGNSQIKIAVLDTGFDLSHPEINHALLQGKDFVNIIDGSNQFIGDYLGYDDEPEDEVGHGTHVTGIISAKGLRMPIGVVPECKIIPVKVLGALKKGSSIVGAGLIDNINNGIKWAVDQGADIINMSLGIKHSGGGLPHQEVIDYAVKRGVTVVAASGNDGLQDKYYPGALPGVIAVGAADDQGNLAQFSTYGGHVSLIAPGVHVYSSFLKDGYAISSGTSQAAPMVSGGIALLKSFALEKGVKLNDHQVKYILKHTSDKINNQFKDFKAGFGKINLLDALKLLQFKFQN